MVDAITDLFIIILIIKYAVLLYVCVAGAPGKVGGLELTYHSEQELRLQWSRPGDFPSDVLITYHINITNTSTGAVTQVGHLQWVCVRLHMPVMDKNGRKYVADLLSSLICTAEKFSVIDYNCGREGSELV